MNIQTDINFGIERAFELLLVLRQYSGDYRLDVYMQLTGFIDGLFWAGAATKSQFFLLSGLAHSAYVHVGHGFPSLANAGPLMPPHIVRDRQIMCKTSHLALPSANFPGPAAAEAIPSPNVGPELHEHQPVPVLTEVVGRVDNDQVSKAAPRRDLYLLCVLVEPRSSALGFVPGRYAPVATMRRLPPLQDCAGRWSYDASAWQVSANRIYVQCGTGLYLRQTPALPFKEILQRLRRRGQATASAQVLAANQQHGQTGAVCADGKNGRSVRAGVAA